ncbi:MAG: hypothetical protein NUW37_14820 [Planctomycetes bacterium]|nr:hypothetical protein [Planctomycetota bacterium]
MNDNQPKKRSLFKWGLRGCGCFLFVIVISAFAIALWVGGLAEKRWDGDILELIPKDLAVVAMLEDLPSGAQELKDFYFELVSSPAFKEVAESEDFKQFLLDNEVLPSETTSTDFSILDELVTAEESYKNQIRAVEQDALYGYIDIDEDQEISFKNVVFGIGDFVPGRPAAKVFIAKMPGDYGTLMLQLLAHDYFGPKIVSALNVALNSPENDPEFDHAKIDDPDVPDYLEYPEGLSIDKPTESIRFVRQVRYYDRASIPTVVDGVKREDLVFHTDEQKRSYILVKEMIILGVYDNLLYAATTPELFNEIRDHLRADVEKIEDTKPSFFDVPENRDLRERLFSGNAPLATFYAKADWLRHLTKVLAVPGEDAFEFDRMLDLPYSLVQSATFLQLIDRMKSYMIDPRSFDTVAAGFDLRFDGSHAQDPLALVSKICINVDLSRVDPPRKAESEELPPGTVAEFAMSPERYREALALQFRQQPERFKFIENAPSDVMMFSAIRTSPEMMNSLVPTLGLERQVSEFMNEFSDDFGSELSIILGYPEASLAHRLNDGDFVHPYYGVGFEFKKESVVENIEQNVFDRMMDVMTADPNAPLTQRTENRTSIPLGDVEIPVIRDSERHIIYADARADELRTKLGAVGQQIGTWISPGVGALENGFVFAFQEEWLTSVLNAKNFSNVKANPSFVEMLDFVGTSPENLVASGVMFADAQSGVTFYDTNIKPLHEAWFSEKVMELRGQWQTEYEQQYPQYTEDGILNLVDARDRAEKDATFVSYKAEARKQLAAAALLRSVGAVINYGSEPMSIDVDLVAVLRRE